MEENDNHGFDYVSSPNGPNKPIPPDPSIEPLPWWNLVGENPVPNDEHTCGLIMKETLHWMQLR